MKKLITTTLLLFCASALAAETLQSLRGDRAIDEMSAPPQLYKWEHESGTIRRQYVQQPPLIPHNVEGYVINKRSNKCLTCHSWANYKRSGATKVSLTHFISRDGVELANISGRRYFCLQCHIPQTNAKPLVENTFQPVDILKIE